ncbi:MAG: chaperone NapD [Gammaproteobacteria bacterium]|nr:chaperone NapD [Gammaproteobacteria bacterium]
MNISGVLVHAYPEKIASVSRHLETIAGLEIHASNEAGKIVVTLEEADDTSMSGKLLDLQKIPGVLNASMIYHQFDELRD